MTHTIYIIGAPGSGKTTALNTALHQTTGTAPTQHQQPIPHLTYGPNIAQLGKQRDTFGGTDALGMGINPAACAHIATRPHPVVTAEGDRLANDRFFRAAQQAGKLTVIWLDLPAETAYARMLKRAETTGNKPQTPQWWQSRNTKTTRLGATHNATRIDATQPPETVATTLATIITNALETATFETN